MVVLLTALHLFPAIEIVFPDFLIPHNRRLSTWRYENSVRKLAKRIQSLILGHIFVTQARQHLYTTQGSDNAHLSYPQQQSSILLPNSLHSPAHYCVSFGSIWRVCQRTVGQTSPIENRRRGPHSRVAFEVLKIKQQNHNHQNTEASHWNFDTLKIIRMLESYTLLRWVTVLR